MMKLASKKAWEKRRTGIQKRKLIDTPFWKYVLSENLYILILCCHDEVPSNFSQIDEKIEVIQEVVLPEISKVND